MAICGGNSTPLAFFSVLTAILPRPGPTGYKNIVPNEHVKQKWRPRTTKFKTFPIGDARFIRSSLLYLCIFASASLTPLRAMKLLHSLGKVKRTKLLNQLFWPKLKRIHWSMTIGACSCELHSAHLSKRPWRLVYTAWHLQMSPEWWFVGLEWHYSHTLLQLGNTIDPPYFAVKEREKRVFFTFVTKHPRCLGFLLSSEFVYVRMKKLHGSLIV